MIKENTYRLIACIIENNDMSAQARADYYSILENEVDAVTILLQYRIDSDVTETYMDDDKYIVDADNDGVYLFEKI